MTRIHSVLNTWNERVQQVKQARLQHSLQCFQHACDESERESEIQRIRKELDDVEFDAVDDVSVFHSAFQDIN